ncbi:MAG: hypothetical protein NZZ60_07785 [Bacteroidia bacterium]|nr:hypothetical protein [Bacteroidia bacterium]MCX7653037.1 hypothetical protein [Bacteroidia bacterium]MDW8416175.1 hypothetical protein [Bacteroidia bacterium]
MRLPSGYFSPQWLYYNGRLWHHPTVRLHEGEVVYFSPESQSIAEKVEGLLSPCWGNMHTHLELSHLRGGIGKGLGMIDFLARMGLTRGQASAAEIRAALTEAFQEGTCAFISHQNSPLPPAAILEGTFVQAVGEFFGLRKGGVRRWHAMRRLGYPLTPHSFYALSKVLLRRARRRSAYPLSIHFYESWEERLWLDSGRGPFLRFFQHFVRRPHPVRWQTHLRRLHHRVPAIWLVHATEAPATLMERLFQRFPRLYVILCPEANYHLFRRLPPLHFWQRYVHRLMLGTDSLANSPSLSLWPVVRRLWMAGWRWESILRACVDTPRSWIKPSPFWTVVAPLGTQAEILPDTKSRLFLRDGDKNEEHSGSL